MQDRYTYIYILFIKGRDSSATQYVCVGADGVFTALILCLIQCKARKSLLILLFRLAWTLFIYRAIANTAALGTKHSKVLFGYNARFFVITLCESELDGF